MVRYTNPDGVANSFQYRTVMLTSIMDEVIADSVKTSEMTADPAIVQATSEADKFKIATTTVQGLGTYDRVKGYPRGSVGITWEEYQLQYDRARAFMLDRVDIMQTGGLATATKTMSEVMRQEVVPEIDKLRLARVIERAEAVVKNTNVEYGKTLTKANILSEMRNGLNHLLQSFRIEEGSTIYADWALKPLLEASTEYQTVRMVSGGGSTLDARTTVIDGNTIKWVPSDYLYSKYDLYDGDTSGQEQGGIEKPSSEATKANFVIVAPGVCNAVTAVQADKYIPNEQNILADADFIALRIFHDNIIMKNKCPGIYVSASTAENRVSGSEAVATLGAEPTVISAKTTVSKKRTT